MANELACLNCGKGFIPPCHITRQKFCSSECRVRYNNAKQYYTDTPVNGMRDANRSERRSRALAAVLRKTLPAAVPL